MKKNIILFICCVLSFYANAFKINRAILAWDGNPRYDNFWPFVSKAWAKRIGIRPTLVYIGYKNKKLDQTYGDVIYFAPIKDIPTPFQATVIRVLIPTLFPNDYCILSDLDMLPLNANFYHNAVKSAGPNDFVVFHHDFYFKIKNDQPNRYIMCYNAAKGYTFRQIFQVRTMYGIRNQLIEWYNKYYRLYKYCCDERILYIYLNKWILKNIKLKLLTLPFRRINRENWNYSEEFVRQNFYIDAHLLRPYIKYENEIDKLLRSYGLL